jgi:hypothetical protein
MRSDQEWRDFQSVPEPEGNLAKFKAMLKRAVEKKLTPSGDQVSGEYAIQFKHKDFGGWKFSVEYPHKYDKETAEKIVELRNGRINLKYRITELNNAQR